MGRTAKDLSRSRKFGRLTQRLTRKETWQSGRMRSPAKGVGGVEPPRRFKSSRLRIQASPPFVRVRTGAMLFDCTGQRRPEECRKGREFWMCSAAPIPIAGNLGGRRKVTCTGGLHAFRSCGHRSSHARELTMVWCRDRFGLVNVGSSEHFRQVRRIGCCLDGQQDRDLKPLNFGPPKALKMLGSECKRVKPRG